MRVKPLVALAVPVIAVAAFTACSDDDNDPETPGGTVEIDVEGSVPAGTIAIDVEDTTEGS